MSGNVFEHFLDQFATRPVPFAYAAYIVDGIGIYLVIATDFLQNTLELIEIKFF